MAEVTGVPITSLNDLDLLNW